MADAADIVWDAAKMCGDFISLKCYTIIRLRDAPIPYAFTHIPTRDVYIYGPYNKALNYFDLSDIVYILTNYTCHEIWHVKTICDNIIITTTREEAEAKRFGLSMAGKIVFDRFGKQIPQNLLEDEYLRIYKNLIDFGLRTYWDDGFRMGMMIATAFSADDRVEAVNRFWDEVRRERGYEEHKIIYVPGKR